MNIQHQPPQQERQPAVNVRHYENTADGSPEAWHQHRLGVDIADIGAIHVNTWVLAVLAVFLVIRWARRRSRNSLTRRT